MYLRYKELKYIVNIKKYRIKKGLKQRELAEALYLSDSFIAKLESITHQTISIDTLEEIAEVLDCDIRDFFDKDILEDNKK